MREIFLHPGALHFGGEDAVIGAILGSCVAITLWHPRLRLGGMCHSMLPGPSEEDFDEDGRFIDGALRVFERQIRARGAVMRDFEAKVLGGGRMFAPSTFDASREIGRLNIDSALDELERRGVRLAAKHCGGTGPRRVLFDLRSGEVRIAQAPAASAAGTPAEEGAPSPRPRLHYRASANSISRLLAVSQPW